jgi:hypothetical protein
MSNYPKAKHSDHEMIAAACVEAKEIERVYDVVVTSTVSMSRRLGVLCIRCEAREKSEEGQGPRLAAYEVEWPNAYTMGFTQTLFQAHVKLHQTISDTYDFVPAEARPPRGRG